MEIVRRKIKDLHFAEYNPRKMSEKEEKELLTSLKRFGFVEPVIVNKHPKRVDVIIGGHQRIRMWSGLGNDEVDTVEMKLTLPQEKELNVRLNKSGGDFDKELLHEFFKKEDLIEWGFKPLELKIEIGKTQESRFDDVKEFKVQLSQEQKEYITQELTRIRRTKAFKDREFTNADKKGNALYYLVEQSVEENE